MSGDSEVRFRAGKKPVEIVQEDGQRELFCLIVHRMDCPLPLSTYLAAPSSTEKAGVRKRLHERSARTQASLCSPWPSLTLMSLASLIVLKIITTTLSAAKLQ